MLGYLCWFDFEVDILVQWVVFFQGCFSDMLYYDCIGVVIWLFWGIVWGDMVFVQVIWWDKE